MSPELAHWLRSVVHQHYKYSEEVYNQVLEVLSKNHQLRPRTRVHTNDQGKSALLLCLYGSLPTVISNHQYNIPVEIWIPLEFSVVAPMAYVVPTPSMLLNPGNHVDANGKCYLPYLSNWNPQSKLIELCTELSKVFALHSPVYSKPANHTPSPALPPKPEPIKHISSPPPIPPIPHTLKQQPFQLSDLLDSEIRPAFDTNRQSLLQQVSIILDSLEKNSINPQLNQFDKNIKQIDDSIHQFDKIFEYEAKQIELINENIIKNESIIKSSTMDTIETIEKINRTPILNPDETIIADSIPKAQLYDLISQDLAINDTLAALNIAFSKGKITFQSLIKHTRQLSRKQFTKRALIRKISIELSIDV